MHLHVSSADDTHHWLQAPCTDAIKERKAPATSTKKRSRKPSKNGFDMSATASALPPHLSQMYAYHKPCAAHMHLISAQVWG